MALEPIVVINGLSSLIFVIISILVGIFIISNYFQHKNMNLIYVGLAWIGLSEPWWASSVSFLIALFNDTGLSNEAYLFIGNVFIPLFILFWLKAMGNLLDWQRMKLISLIYTIASITFEILFMIFLFINYSIIGQKVGPVDADFGLFTILFLFINLVLFFGTGIWFAVSSVKSDDKRVKLKGQFLLVAFITFVFGTAWDIIATNPLTRLLLVISAVIFYIGFVLPPNIQKLFIKE
ncbi:MAG: hypothetical protein GF317_13795 [Candidatus Lokiarchaeota archaeon]|nr:hypothetical protein [Candidatus Lokiarchaeota archaeon]MBD3200700.1 hypothetical protein [Candidatus Lokiarchaeota archaeon]